MLRYFPKKLNNYLSYAAFPAQLYGLLLTTRLKPGRAQPRCPTQRKLESRVSQSVCQCWGPLPPKSGTFRTVRLLTMHV